MHKMMIIAFEQKVSESNHSFSLQQDTVDLGCNAVERAKALKSAITEEQLEQESYCLIIILLYFVYETCHLHLT